MESMIRALARFIDLRGRLNEPFPYSGREQSNAAYLERDWKKVGSDLEVVLQRERVREQLVGR